MSWRADYQGFENGRHHVDYEGVAGDPLRIAVGVPESLDDREWASTLRICGETAEDIEADVSEREPTSDELAQWAALVPTPTEDLVAVQVFDYGALEQGEYAYDIQNTPTSADDPSTVMGGKVLAHRQWTA